jgi:ankyrin repeat protein
VIGDELLDLACLSYRGNDSTERHKKAQRLLDDNPALAQANIFTASAVGDAKTVDQLLRADPAASTATGGPRDWEPLLYLCYARIQSNDPQHSPLEAAKVLLANGADANARTVHDYGSVFTALTGALGEGEGGPQHQPPHAQCSELARLLLDEGAEANDSQALYNRMFQHGPGNECIALLLEYGLNANDKVNWQQDSSIGMFDFLLENAAREGFLSRVLLLLENGADPNFTGFYAPQQTPYQHALAEGHEQTATIIKQAAAKGSEKR